MKRQTLHIIALLFCTLFCTQQSIAQDRRPIDPQHPAWLIHIDVWNNADPQKIIDLIPEDIKPYVIMNLSMSCSYDKSIDMYQKPQDAIQTYRSWASVCCRNNMWFTCQPASGGHTHIPEGGSNFENALAIHEQFFKDYPNFLGWNYAEQFWGFNEQGDKSSSSDVDRIKLFAKLVPLHHEYGGFLTISFCGNIWSHPLNPVGMMKRNADFLKACQQYPEAMLFLYKYTTSANWFNNESVSIAPFISGLAKNYGVRYDNCGWNGAIDELCKNDGKKHTYPGAVGIAPVLEQMCLNGACVWDGPELIWTEDFRETSRKTVAGFQRRTWGTFPNFDNIWVDMFRKVLDGSIHIATREEVIQRTQICVINDISASSDQSGLKVNAYAAPIDLYHGLYLQDNDPFNARVSYESGIGNVAGYGNNNFLYYKKTGRYQTIPVVISLHDSLAKTIPVQVRRSTINNKQRWSSQSAKVVEFNRKYPEISKGDMFVARHHNELVCYTPYSYLNERRSSKATIPLQYNTCNELKLEFPLFGNALAKEYDDHIYFYLNNYRSDSTAAKTDAITISGASAQPTYTYANRGTTKAQFAEEWNAEDGTYTLKVTHNGPVDLTINCAGTATERLTDVLSDEAITEIPAQPDDYVGDLIIEAEDMDYKSIAACVTDAYNSQYRSWRGHSGMGFAAMGTNTSATLRDSTVMKAEGTYTVTVKYRTDGPVVCRAKVNSKSITFTLQKTNGEWATHSFDADFKEGKNLFTIQTASGRDIYIDNVTFTPSQEIILAVESAASDDNSTPEAFYSISGIKQSSLHRGLNLVRMSNGKVKKVMVK